MTKVTEDVYETNDPRLLSALPQGYTYVNDCNIQTSSSLKQLSKPEPNFMWILIGNGDKIYINDQGHMVKMTAIPLHIFSSEAEV